MILVIYLSIIKTFSFAFVQNEGEKEREKTCMARESKFQSDLIKELKIRFPGCFVTKLDSGHTQGIPDLLILWNDRWATLECKKSKNAKHQPNQNYYVNKMNEMSFSAFIYPENKEEVLHELQQAFRV